MRIASLYVENYKRLGVVEITPEGNLVTIGGKNGQGKSSVLDAIYVALKGRAVAPPKPVRKGEEKSTIRLDLGDLIVHRTFVQKEGVDFTSTLKLESADGLLYKKPQDVLDALLGEIGFDPFEFINLKPKEQTARLLEMVPLSIDLDEYAQRDASDFAKRTESNRDVTRLRAQVEAIAVEEVPADLPDRNALTDQLGNAADHNGAIAAERTRREMERAAIDRRVGDAEKHRANAVDIREQIEEMTRRAAEQDDAAAAVDTEIEEREEVLASLPNLEEETDTNAIRQQLHDAEAIHAVAARQTRRAELAAELTTAEALSQSFTHAMAERAKQRNAALASAEMPVEGLAFAIDEEGRATLTYDGLPFTKDQISTAVQLRVSTAIGMAANPRLRVLRIKDGSLLDEDSMADLAAMADTDDFQIWVEVVGDGGVGIIMENGVIRGTPEPEERTQDESKETPADDGPAQGSLV